MTIRLAWLHRVQKVLDCLLRLGCARRSSAMAVSTLINLPGTVIPSPSSKDPYPLCNSSISRRLPSHRLYAKPKRWRMIRAAQDTKETNTNQSAEQITQKYGLEAGLWKIFSSKEDDMEEREKKKSRTDEAKELLAKYGGAYLATSISLSLVSFALCYLLISAGVDVAALLQKVGILTNETGEKVGTFALAYAAHKAASPIRFPPTVALTPIVASWIGSFKKSENENK